MSDSRIVESDKSRGVLVNRAIADTVGMTRPQAAAFWLEGLAKRAHRGPRIDTWTSARDRAAKIAGVKPSMAARIWHRWQDMKDVSGDALFKLMIAYEAMCSDAEAVATGLRSERLALEADHAATIQSARHDHQGMAAAEA